MTVGPAAAGLKNRAVATTDTTRGAAPPMSTFQDRLTVISTSSQSRFISANFKRLLDQRGRSVSGNPFLSGLLRNNNLRGKTEPSDPVGMANLPIAALKEVDD